MDEFHMVCVELQDKLNDYLDGTLTVAGSALVDTHIAGCSACQRLVGRERELRELLRSYGESAVPVPDKTYFDAALRTAVREGRIQSRNRWLMTGFAGAIVAAVAVWITGSVIVDSPSPVPQSQMAEISMTVEEPRTVNLVFSADSDLRDARLTLLLPEGVELAGFAGRAQVSWQTDLNKGRNVLPLTLIGRLPTEGEMQAVLKHREDDREFRIRIKVI